MSLVLMLFANFSVTYGIRLVMVKKLFIKSGEHISLLPLSTKKSNKRTVLSKGSQREWYSEIALDVFGQFLGHNLVKKLSMTFESNKEMSGN